MINQNLSSLLEDQVTLDIEGIDRMYLNVYQPLLQNGGGAHYFFTQHRGKLVASTVLMQEMSQQFVHDIGSFVFKNGIDLVRFKKGQRKDDETQRRLRASEDDTERVLYVGKAQEKCSVFRMTRRTNEETGEKYPWLYRADVNCNQYYFYLVDDDFGPMFIKMGSYFPYTCRVNLNGHEYAKRQLDKAGIGYEALDNGVLRCDDPERLQSILDRLDEHKIAHVINKWLARLPSPFTDEDRQAGFRYRFSILQAEFARTQVFERPLCGRQWFEQVIRDHLDLGRPDQVSLIFSRRITKRTPSRFSTRVVTRGVAPSLYVSYKNSGIKQYFKLERALRTETTVNNTRDFGIGRMLCNLPQLREVGFEANRRLLEAQKLSHNCQIGMDAFDRVNAPQVVDGQRASALGFGQPRTMALFQALCLFMWLPQGFRNAALKEQVATFLGLEPEQYSSGAMTYDLRRLRLHGVIEKIPRTHRYHLTPEGLRVCLFMVKVHQRLFINGLSQMCDDSYIEQPGSVARAGRQMDRAIEKLIKEAQLSP